MAAEMDRETLTKFHQQDRRLAEVQDKEKRASSEAERREIRRGYYREVRAENEAAGEGRRYPDRRDMMNNGRRDVPIGALGPSQDAVAAAAERPPARFGRTTRGRSWAIGWERKR